MLTVFRFTNERSFTNTIITTIFIREEEEKNGHCVEKQKRQTMSRLPHLMYLVYESNRIILHPHLQKLTLKINRVQK